MNKKNRVERGLVLFYLISCIVAEEAIAKATKAERERRWKEEHAEAFAAYNRYIEGNGVPFSDLRKF